MGGALGVELVLEVGDFGFQRRAAGRTNSSASRRRRNAAWSEQVRHLMHPLSPVAVWGMPSKKIATTSDVDCQSLLEFVRARHRVVLLTRRADGSPQLSPVTAGVDEAGRIVVATYPERAKVVNIRSSPDVSVLVLSDEWNDAWVQVDGTAEVLDLPEALEPLVEYFRSVAGEHSDWDEYREAMRHQGKALIRISPTRWGPVATGGFPPRLAE